MLKDGQTYFKNVAVWTPFFNIMNEKVNYSFDLLNFSWPSPSSPRYKKTVERKSLLWTA